MTILLAGAVRFSGTVFLKHLLDVAGDCQRLVDCPESISYTSVPNSGGGHRAGLDRALKGMSAIVHLSDAAPAADPGCGNDPEAILNLIDAAKASAGDARFILVRMGLEFDEGARRGRSGPIAADPVEEALRASGLNWVILRFGDVSGSAHLYLASKIGKDGMVTSHSVPVSRIENPAEIARAVQLALSGAVDESVVNIVEEASTFVHEAVFSVNDAA